MSTVTLRRFGLVSSFVAVSVVAIGTQADAKVLAKAKKTCDVLTASEIQQVVGQPVGKPKKSKLRSNICQWPVGSDTSDHVSVLLERGAEAKGAYDAAKDPGLYQLSEIAGLGKDAFFAPSIKTVWVLKDPKVAFYVQGLYPDVTQSQLEELAKTALLRA